jgi:hypothetical protein
MVQRQSLYDEGKCEVVVERMDTKVSKHISKRRDFLV